MSAGQAVGSPTRNTVGALWMLGNSAAFSLQLVIIKILTADLPMSMVMLFMVGVQGLFVWGTNLRDTGSLFSRERPHLMHLVRAGVMMLGLFAGVASVGYLPVAGATALSFCKPLFVLALGTLILGEVADWRRVLAVALGFAGVLILARPSTAGFSLFGVGLGLLSALAAAGAAITTRVLARRDRASVLMMYQTAAGAILFLPFALHDWAVPDPQQLGLLFLSGILSVLGNLFTILALRNGEASSIAPVDFTRAIFAGLFALVLLGEVPTAGALAGMAVIIVGAVIGLRGGRRASLQVIGEKTK